MIVYDVFFCLLDNLTKNLQLYLIWYSRLLLKCLFFTKSHKTGIVEAFSGLVSNLLPRNSALALHK